MRLPNLVGIFCLVAVASVFGIQKANADTSSDGRLHYESIPDAFERQFFDKDRIFSQNRTLGRTSAWLFFSFPENEITQDGRGIYNLYREVLNQQVSNAPIIRTPDLPNPYDNSLLSLPPVNQSIPSR